MSVRALATMVEQYLAGSSSSEAGAAGSPALKAAADDGLWLIRRTEPTGLEATVYEPIVCLILQGEKVTTVGERSVTLAKGQCVLVSHDLPVVAQITKASTAAPYLAIVVRVDLAVIRSLYDEVGDAGFASEGAHALAVADADEEVVSVLTRYVGLFKDATSVKVLAPLVRRELHFRLLMSTPGAMLRSLLRRDSHASRISAAIKTLRGHFREPFEVAELAKSVGMSTSSFHKHFKAVTMTTPLQFQKNLRLTQARDLLWKDGLSVSAAAYEVGYESPSQFSREYTRKFGTSPQADKRPG